jgi:Fe-S cluster assembly protein SufD
MTATTQPVTEHEVNLAAPAHDLAPRVISTDPAAFGVPTGREEEWRFTPLRRLLGLHDGSCGTGLDLAATWQASGADVRVVGHDDAPVGQWYVPTDRVAAQAFAGAASAVVVTVPAETSGASVTLTLAGGAVPDGDAGTSGQPRFGHLVVDVAANATATVVIDHVGGLGAVATIVETHVGQGGSLTLVSNHDWSRQAAHLGHQHTVLEADASLRSIVVTLGGDLVRHVASVEYRGQGGRADLLGVHLTDAGQHHEHRLFVDHSVPRCTSDVVYKGALQGQDAHSVWIGDVLIRAAALGTRTYELNRNLVLTEGARADSVPNLEIETGRIEGAGHASATGRFDDEQLFYLTSRGLPAAVARRLVVRGFFLDALARIGDPALSAEITAAVDAKLGALDPLYDFASLDRDPGLGVLA